MGQEQVEQILRSYEDPWLKQDWLTAGAVDSLVVTGPHVELSIRLPYPFAGVAQAHADAVQSLLAQAGLTSGLRLQLSVPRVRPQAGIAGLEAVKNIIVVASGKGGVGKSTTAVNLALALAKEGARVGLLDADIYGPSQPMMVGIAVGTRPAMADEKHLAPMRAHGIDVMSMGFLVDEQTPVVWRGPMATGALLQLLTQTRWNDLDYLVVDMPPGTGDIQLTLAQKVPVAGAVIVTTPQDIALLDAKKGIEMFRKVEIPVLGVVENMATHVCSQCGHEEHVFGEGGGERIAREYATELLGALPLDLRIRQDADGGHPTVVADSEGELARRYREIARKVGVALAQREHVAANRIPNIVFTAK